MKVIGFILLVVGFCMLFFVGYIAYRERMKLVSPVPDPGGMKVIYVTPSP